jgi:RPA family protein
MNNKNMKKIYNILMAAAIALGTFTSCEDVPMPFNNPLDYLKPDPEEEVIDPVGDGTKDSPFNVAGVLAYLNELGPDVESTKDIYVTGVVTSVKEAFSTQYGNAQFVISDTEDGTNQFTFYRGLYLGNKKYANENDVNIQENDVVVICGKIVNYRGSTPETVQGKAYVVSINGKGADVPEAKTGEAKGAGTQSDPYNVAGVLNYLNGLGADVTSPNEVYIKGKVKEITEQFGTQYGNATFTMIDEGFDAVFTAYRVLYLGNKKYTEGDLLKENDEVIVCGKVVNFKGNTPETSQNTGYLYSLNGKTADGGGGGSSEDIKTVSIADFNAAPVSDTWYQLTGTVKNLKDGDQYGNFDLEDATGSVYVYGLLSEKGGEKKKFQELVAAKGIKEGSKITIIGNRGEYNDKIEVLNAYFVSIEGGNESGGGGGGETTDAGISADNPFTPAQANAFIAGLDADQNTEQDYYIKGKIIEITDKNQFNTQYGNCTFYISDDGTDKDEKFYVFRTLYLGNVKYNDESWTLPKAGDEVVICGKVVNYKGNTPETVANKSYIYSLNGKTAARKK